MTHRSLMIAAMAAIVLAAMTPRSSGVVSAQRNDGQPVSVFVAAFKGDCLPDRVVAVVNGQLMVGPPIRAPYNMLNTHGSGKTILNRFADDPISQKIAEDEFRKNKAFRVVDTPMRADFVFCLCSKYQYARMRQGGNRPEMMRIGTRAGAVSVESYSKASRDPKALIEAAFWKSDDWTPNQLASKADEKDKKRKKPEDKAGPEPPPEYRADRSQGGANEPGIARRAPAAAPPGFQPELPLSDLVKGFIKRWPSFAAMVAAQPDSQFGASGGSETPRPKLPSGVPAEIATGTKPVVETAAADPSALRIETTLIVTPVMAMDRDGKYLPGLAATDFDVYEDGVKQEISDFGGSETPIHVALVLDVSGSTRFKLEDIQDAALDFVDQLRPQDRVMVVSFDQQVYVETEFTNEREKLMRAILRTRSGGSTRVQDALDLTMTERLEKIQGRKAIVIFTDGMDNASYLATWEDVKARIEESGALVYPVRYDTLVDMTSPFTLNGINATPPQVKITVDAAKEEYARAAQNLKNLATASGGRYYDVETIGDTKQAFANIAEELRQYYWLGYYPPSTVHDGKYHKINVVIDKQGVVLRARPGYRAPADDKAKSK
ncbi:MAG: VWA domain-containing protein [Blastocatellia bacterium]|nr:VWA domain-containing protein [Blastocatellia bacterium]